MIRVPAYSLLESQYLMILHGQSDFELLELFGGEIMDEFLPSEAIRSID